MRPHNALSKIGPKIVAKTGPKTGPVLLGAALIALVAGCNNGTGNPAPSGAAPASGAANSVPDGGDVTSPPPAARPKKKIAKDQKPSQSPGLDPGVNPLDVFVVVPGEPKWEVVEADGKRVSADAFTGILPPRGIDSTHFEPPDSGKPPVPLRPPSRPVAPPSDTDRPATGRKTGGRKTGDHKTANHQATGRRGTASNRKSGDRKPGDRKSGDRQMAERNDDSQTAEPATSEQGHRLPSGFTALPSAKESPLGWPSRIRCDRDGAEMALVTGGAVVVGHDGGPPESSPQLSVVLDSFYMDVSEVTVGQYERFRKALKEERGRNIVGEPTNALAPRDLPVLGMTLIQAQFYARWAGKEIPTEAEWERAARGEAAFDHPWGNGRAIWKHARGYDEIDPVKSFRTDVSPFGIYDLAGNAREWCVDHYSPTAFADAIKTSSGQLRNWKGPRSGHPENARVVKGNGPNWDAWHRVGRDGSHPQPDVGFRCVLRLPERDSAAK